MSAAIQAERLENCEIMKSEVNVGLPENVLILK